MRTSFINCYTKNEKDSRPWGSWEVLNVGEGYCVKKIIVLPRERLSYQFHQHRSEQWLIVEGRALVTLGGEVSELKEGEMITIPIGTLHSIENKRAAPLILLEIQKGIILREEDIVRVKDKYGRAGN